jgi:hypothetical protein
MMTQFYRPAVLSVGVSLVLLIGATALQAQPDAKGDKDGQGAMKGMQMQ